MFKFLGTIADNIFLIIIGLFVFIYFQKAEKKIIKWLGLTLSFIGFLLIIIEKYLL